MRVRITMLGDDPHVHFRGYMDVDDLTEVGEFSDAMKPWGLVIASIVDDDYSPFKEAGR